MRVYFCPKYREAAAKIAARWLKGRDVAISRKNTDIK